MIILAFLTAVFIGLAIFISRPDTFITLSFGDYQFYLSLFTIAAAFFAILFVWKLLMFPFSLCNRYQKWQKQKKEQKRQDFLGSVLQAQVNNNKEVYPLLAKRLPKALNRDESLYWTVLALLQPEEKVYQKLLTFPETTLGGIRGFLHIAEDQGNLEEIHNLLDSLTDSQKKVRWVQYSYLQLYIMENDWANALNTLEVLRKTMPKKEYISKKACLLLMLGEVENAYKLDPTQTAIVLAYAKATPKKALKILQKLWKEAPCWEIYTAYKEMLQSETPKVQKKDIKKLIGLNPGNRFSILAKADFALSESNYALANDILKEYLENYALTQQVALMFARIEREANNNEQNALAWEQRASEIQEKSGWACTNCSYTSNKWEAVCPACHVFNTFIPN